ncbi:hypothetical protein F7734_28955 [Scytonema sp. UIC 10036]|uniref:hypothetical protein n=1 Tax=Scytonema sp. UIC 10036 TaxID=2304196 RepID=UPI0012DA3CD3|nr:hypothetical protein [Scytonema sp. UIC 10036]MUG96153.1 hypothetical protein [Scytonema sp. UIC 10036]
MKIDREEQLTRKLLGYFICDRISCFIVNWYYLSVCLDYLGESDDECQIIMPTHSDLGIEFAKY